LQALDPRVDRESFTLLSQIKKDFARLIRARSDEISYLPNTTAGINHILLGLNLRPGERILLPEVEFPALVYPILYLARQKKLKVEFLPCPQGRLSIKTLHKSLARKKAALVATSWVQYHNGYRYDAPEMVKVCHQHGVFVLFDGTQGVGVIPLNVKKAGVDALACGGQKWLFCQTGSGFLYISPQALREVKPAVVGWLSADWGYRFGNLQHHDRPLYPDGRRFEWGTYPYYNLRAAQVGLELLNAAGVRRSYRQIIGLLDQLSEYLSGSPYTISSDLSPRHRSAILAFSGPRIACLHRYLNSKGFKVSLRENNIRVSPHFYNTKNEMQRFTAAIREFTRSGKRA